MTVPLDVYEEVSQELSTIMESVLDHHDSDQPVTLDSVREAMHGNLVTHLVTADRIHPDEEESLSAEIDALIEQFGEDAVAVRFARPRASEDLTTVIEAEMEKRDPDQPPTLEVIREAMHAGLVANLIGRGDIADDEEQTLYAEIEGLIERHGQDAIAERFVRDY